MDSPESPYQVPGTQAAEGPPSFFVRLVALPFWPRLWRESPEYGVGTVLLPLLVWLAVGGVLLSLRTADEVRKSAYRAADYYEENADPLLLENGRFTLQGERILRLEDDDHRSTLLIDPEETVPDDELETEQSFVVRADRVELKQPMQTRVYTAKEVASLLGQRVLIDGDWIRHKTDEWLYPLVVAGVSIGFAVSGLVSCTVYALAVGLVLMLFRGQWLGLGYAQCFTIALATSAFTVAADLALKLTGAGEPVKGIVLWPLVMTGLGMLALLGRKPPPAEA